MKASQNILRNVHLNAGIYKNETIYWSLSNISLPTQQSRSTSFSSKSSGVLWFEEECEYLLSETAVSGHQYTSADGRLSNTSVMEEEKPKIIENCAYR